MQSFWNSTYVVESSFWGFLDEKVTEDDKSKEIKLNEPKQET